MKKLISILTAATLVGSGITQVSAFSTNNIKNNNSKVNNFYNLKGFDFKVSKHESDGKSHSDVIGYIKLSSAFINVFSKTGFKEDDIYNVFINFNDFTKTQDFLYTHGNNGDGLYALTKIINSEWTEIVKESAGIYNVGFNFQINQYFKDKPGASSDTYSSTISNINIAGTTTSNIMSNNKNDYNLTSEQFPGLPVYKRLTWNINISNALAKIVWQSMQAKTIADGFVEAISDNTSLTGAYHELKQTYTIRDTSGNDHNFVPIDLITSYMNTKLTYIKDIFPYINGHGIHITFNFVQTEKDFRLIETNSTQLGPKVSFTPILAYATKDVVFSGSHGGYGSYFYIPYKLVQNWEYKTTDLFQVAMLKNIYFNNKYQSLDGSNFKEKLNKEAGDWVQNMPRSVAGLIAVKGKIWHAIGDEKQAIYKMAADGIKTDPLGGLTFVIDYTGYNSFFDAQFLTATYLYNGWKSLN